MKKIFVGNLPQDTTEAELTELFNQFGEVRGLKLATDLFSGKCRGFGFIEMEGHHARAAMAGLDGKELRGNNIKVREERPQKGRRGRR